MSIPLLVLAVNIFPGNFLLFSIKWLIECLCLEFEFYCLGNVQYLGVCEVGIAKLEESVGPVLIHLSKKEKFNIQFLRIT